VVLHAVNEHFENVLNAVATTQVVIQRLLRTVAQKIICAIVQVLKEALAYDSLPRNTPLQ
jgi:hypothetical protein